MCHLPLRLGQAHPLPLIVLGTPLPLFDHCGFDSLRGVGWERVSAPGAVAVIVDEMPAFVNSEIPTLKR
jgi:hypothetical protein